MHKGENTFTAKNQQNKKLLEKNSRYKNVEKNWELIEKNCNSIEDNDVEFFIIKTTASAKKEAQVELMKRN